MTRTRSKAQRELPRLAVGDAFRVRSRSGRNHLLTYISQGEDQAGIYVRLPDRRLARLDPERIRWDAFERVPEGAVPLLRPGDEVLLETGRELVRGSLTSQTQDGVLVDQSGTPRSLAWVAIVEALLAFHAPALRAGDRFLVKSRSGNEYRGTIRRADRDNLLEAELSDGRRVTFRLDRLDLASLTVLIPIPLERLRAQLQEQFAATLPGDPLPAGTVVHLDPAD